MSAEIERVLAQLKSSGRRRTRQRSAVIAVLLDSRKPVSVESIFRQVGENHGKIDLVTGYRILGALEKVGVVTRLFGRGGVALFVLQNSPRRYFAVSKDDGALIEIDHECAEAIERCAQQSELHLSNLGYRELTHVVQFFVGSAPRPDAIPTQASQT